MTRTLAEKAAATSEAVKLARSLCGSDVGESSWRVEVLAQALAEAESRGRAEASAEVARLTAELAEANAGLAQYVADIESLGDPDAPWPETLQAIKAAMRIEKLRGLQDGADRERLAADVRVLRVAANRSRCAAEAVLECAALNRIAAALGVKL